MNLWQAFKMAFKSIAMKKTRSFLTMLGIIIGVASVVIMVSVVQAQNQQAMQYWEKLGDNKINISAYSYTDVNNETGQMLSDYCLSLGSMVLGITPDVTIWEQMNIQYGAKNLMTNGDVFDPITGMVDWSLQYTVKLGSESYGVCNNVTLAGGREISYLDIEKENAVCVLGSGMKNALFGNADPVGETITIGGNAFLVVGWYNPIGITGWEEFDSVAVVPYTFNRTMNRNQTISSYIIKARDAEATVEVMTRLDAFLSGLFPRNAGGGRENGDYYINSNDSYVQEMQNQNLTQSLVLGAIAGISLLVGGIGIMNIMLVTVTERTREIGIRKAIGAERKSIIAQFLIEASVICSIGGLIGIGLGTVGTMIAGKLLIVGLTEILTPNTAITVGAFLFSVVLGIIFGMYPAIKASGLQPVAALRAD